MEAIIKMKCKECKGTMDIEAGKSIMFCPYCGSKELIVESDEVKIAQINADLEKAKLEHEIELQKMADEKEAKETKDFNRLGIFLFVFIILSVAIMLILDI